MLSRTFLSCSLLALTVACSASSAPPTGGKGALQNSDSDDDGPSGAGGSSVDPGPAGPSDGPQPAASVPPAGVTDNGDGTVTVVDEEGNVTIIEGMTDEEGNIVTDDGSVLVPNEVDDI